MELDTTIYHNNPISADAAAQLCSMSLEEKDFATYQKITEWYLAWAGRCYVSFSGGKDSTLLAYLVAQSFVENEWNRTPLALCFFDTGLEYPEIRDFMLR